MMKNVVSLQDMTVEELNQHLEDDLSPADRAAAKGELGRRHVRLGHHDVALRHLVSARRIYENLEKPRARAEMDAAIGAACSYKGEHERATTYLARALDTADEIGDNDLRSRTINVLAEQALRRGDLDRASELWQHVRNHFEQFWDGRELSRCLSGLAIVAAAQGSLDSATELATRSEEEAETAGDPLWTGRAQLAQAEVLWHKSDHKRAKRYFRRAITLFQKNGLRRELGEAYLRYGMFAGQIGEESGKRSTDPAAYWLAKAQEIFRELGGLNDLERVREAFRRYGRRATDRIAEVEVLQLLQELKHCRVSVQRETHLLADQVIGAVDNMVASSADDDGNDLLGLRENIVGIERTLSRSLDDMALAEERFLEAVNAVVVERENIRSLIELARLLSAIDDYAILPGEIAKMAAKLTSADRAAVATVSETGEMDVCGYYGMEQTGEDETKTEWTDHLRVTAVEDGRAKLLYRKTAAGDKKPLNALLNPSGRVDEQSRQERLRLGYAMVVPIHQANRRFGAIYVDKHVAGGVFTERDLDLVAVFAGQAAVIMENCLIQARLRLAARTTAATLDAVHDAVISMDADYNITSLNSTAMRLLKLDPTKEKRRAGTRAIRTLDAVPSLSFLGGCLDRREELENKLVTLDNAEFLCNTRVIRDRESTVAGLVATLTELKRATTLAQRIVGSSARYSFTDLIGDSPSLKRRLVLAEAAARSDSNVLITGESGTGKEVLAQAIHNGGNRAAGPFVALNCAAIPRDLLESELFGYESGAFTGARKGGRPGKFELAEGGTILLDEIGDMPHDMQAKLLRVLQERTAQRLGGTREIPLNCRVVATTNRDLAAAVGTGLFRQDLFFRLRVIHIDLPPLRERPEDIERLTRHFLGVFSKRMDKQVTTVSANVMQVLQQYPWPGNVRELEHVLEGEVNLAHADALALDEVPVMLEVTMRSGQHHQMMTPNMVQPGMPMDPRMHPPGYPGNYPPGAGMPPQRYPDQFAPPHPAPPQDPRAMPPPGGGGVKTMSESERDLLEAALVAHRGRIPAVARALGVSRGTVYNKMKKFNLDPSSYRN